MPVGRFMRFLPGEFIEELTKLWQPGLRIRDALHDQIVFGIGSSYFVPAILAEGLAEGFRIDAQVCGHRQEGRASGARYGRWTAVVANDVHIGVRRRLLIEPHVAV